MAFVHGLFFGFTLMVMIGPIFFTIIQTSIDKGFAKASLVAIGVSVGDALLIMLVYFGLSKIIGFNENKVIISYIGAVILLLFGIINIAKARRKTIVKTEEVENQGMLRYFFKGLVINAISPFVPIFWIGTMSIATIQYGYEGFNLLIFFSTIVAVVFATDLLKAYLAHRLSNLINPQIIKWLNITVGIVLILFAVRMATYF